LIYNKEATDHGRKKKKKKKKKKNKTKFQMSQKRNQPFQQRGFSFPDVHFHQLEKMQKKCKFGD